MKTTKKTKAKKPAPIFHRITFTPCAVKWDTPPESSTTAPESILGMKQAKASVAEAEALLRWLQRQEAIGRNPPPYNRTVHGYLLMLEHCADPAKDFIDFKPGTSPDEIAALRAKIAELEGALEAGQRNCDEVYNDLRAERDAARTNAERFDELEDAFRDRQWFDENASNAKTLAEMADALKKART